MVLLVSFYLFLSVYNFGAPWVSPNSVFHLVSGLAMTTAASTCCVVDSKIIGKPLTLSTQWMTAVYWPVTVPVYLLWSRRWRGALIAAGLALLLAGVALQATLITSLFATV